MLCLSAMCVLCKFEILHTACPQKVTALCINTSPPPRLKVYVIPLLTHTT